MRFKYNDGGRAEAGFTGNACDCVVRAIAIATGRPYKDVYRDISILHAKAAKGRGLVAARIRRVGISPDNGSYRNVYNDYIIRQGFKWVSCMDICTGCVVHVREYELPENETLILRLSKHLVAVVNGEINDTHDPSRDGSRCVYGYYIKVKK